MRATMLRLLVLAGILVASAASLDALSTSIPVVRIAASAAEADPSNNVIAPVPGDRVSCLAYVAGGEASLPPSFDVARGIDTFGPGYYKRLARTLTHMKAMVAAYRLGADAVLILDETENPIAHPDFSFWDSETETDALAEYVTDLTQSSPGWQHVQLSVLALSDAFGGLVKDWDEAGRPIATELTPANRNRGNAELWSYGAYLVSKKGLASTLLHFADRSHTSAEESGSKPLRFDLSHATCIEADNCVMWEGVAGAGWLVATPPLFAPGRQAATDESDASDVEVPVSELVKENMFHVKRWWEEPEELLSDAKQGSLRLPSDEVLDATMRAGGVDPLDARPGAKPSRGELLHQDSATTKAGYDERTAVPATTSGRPETRIEKRTTSPPERMTIPNDAFDDATRAVGSRSVKRHSKSAKSAKRRSSGSSKSTRSRSHASSVKKAAKAPSDALVDARVEPISVRAATGSDAPPATGKTGKTAPTTHGAERVPISAAENAARVAAGITRTESAFEYGETLFDQAWGGDDAGLVAAQGRLEGETTTKEGDVLDLLVQYRDEPRLGRSRFSSFEAPKLGEAIEISTASKKLTSVRAASIAGGLGIAAAVVAAAAAASRRRPETEARGSERAGLLARRAAV